MTFVPLPLASAAPIWRQRLLYTRHPSTVKRNKYDWSIAGLRESMTKPSQY